MIVRRINNILYSVNRKVHTKYIGDRYRQVDRQVDDRFTSISTVAYQDTMSQPVS